MLAVDCPPQVVAWACKLEGLLTVAPFDGVLTTTPPPAVSATSVSQKAPELPQAFTRSVCAPSEAETSVSIEVVPLKTVSLPESREFN